jgi:hypothetical protein
MKMVPSDYGPTVVSDIPSLGSLQFTVDEVEQALLDFSTVDPQKLYNFVFSSSLPDFNRSLITCVFPEKWKLSFVTPIYKSVKRNDVANYRTMPRGIAILSAVAKLS